MIYFKTACIILIMMTSFAHSGPNHVIYSDMNMDNSGRLIQPDKIHFTYAYKNYQDGYFKAALISFMKSAAFGNSEAQKNIGIMHLNSLGTPKNSIKGYAWIKLASQYDTKISELEHQLFIRLTKSEQESAIEEYSKLKEIYSPIATLDRRDKWARLQKKKMTGTRTGSTVPHIASLRPNGSGGFAMLSNDTNQIIHDFKSFVLNYNYGTVTLRDLKLHEDKEEKDSY
jgi:hypothetical protein